MSSGSGKLKLKGRFNKLFNFLLRVNIVVMRISKTSISFFSIRIFTCSQIRERGGAPCWFSFLHVNEKMDKMFAEKGKVPAHPLPLPILRAQQAKIFQFFDPRIIWAAEKTLWSYSTYRIWLFSFTRTRDAILKDS